MKKSAITQTHIDLVLESLAGKRWGVFRHEDGSVEMPDLLASFCLRRDRHSLALMTRGGLNSAINTLVKNCQAEIKNGGNSGFCVRAVDQKERSNAQ